MKNNLSDLIEVSRKFGNDPDWILVGGGNTSMKENGRMWVKASGFELATIEAHGFVEMNLDSLNAIWDKEYPADEKERESHVLEDMMNARSEGQTARPSVEALLHSLVKGRLVVHTHPALINGLTCGIDGEAAAKELFGDDALWVPLTRPGYILAKEIRTRIDALEAAGKPYPEIILLQNHGLFISGETPEDINRLHKKTADKVRSRVADIPADTAEDLAAEQFSVPAESAWGRKVAVRAAVNSDILSLAETDGKFEAVRIPFNPDQIVYAGPGPLRIDDIAELTVAVAAYNEKWKREPQAVFVKGMGMFAVGDTDKKAYSALALMLDTVKIAVYSRSFGGALPMTDELIIFIRDWEVEHYRAKVSK